MRGAFVFAAATAFVALSLSLPPGIDALFGGSQGQSSELADVRRELATVRRERDLIHNATRMTELQHENGALRARLAKAEADLETRRVIAKSVRAAAKVVHGQIDQVALKCDRLTGCKGLRIVQGWAHRIIEDTDEVIEDSVGSVLVVTFVGWLSWRLWRLV